MSEIAAQYTLDVLRRITRQTEYENRLFLVGGYVRDKLLGRSGGFDDIDLVLEGDALKLARFLWRQGVSSHAPVVYPKFGTAMIHIQEPAESLVQVELVTARAETYQSGSRQPTVTPGTLLTDARRRDFTINTFLENLHTGEIIDPTEKAHSDLASGILRTPLDPAQTFADDPLRMLRACRFAAKLNFAIAPTTMEAIIVHADRCNAAYGISFERIRDELNKTLLAPGAAKGLELMRQTRLLDQFAPELVAMYGVTQNRFHLYDVWRHTLVALENLPSESPLELRLGVLLHDIGKPATRTEDSEGEAHFYNHEDVGAQIARELLFRLRYPNETVDIVTRLVALHMRYGSYTPSWSDAAVRRLIRSVGELRQDLFTVAHADIAACNPDIMPVADLDSLSERMELIESVANVTTATSPLTGEEIIALLDIAPGRIIGKIKVALTDAVVAGELAQDDREGAIAMAKAILDS
ncbi:MAG: HD domain-containing protein [bacterium]